MPVEEKFDLAFGRVSTLWRSRDDIKRYGGLVTKKFLERVCPLIVFDKYGGTTLELKPVRKGQFAEEVKGTPMSYPNMEVEHHSPTETNQVYMSRYNPVKWNTVSLQFKFLEKTIDMVHSTGAPIILVNMPLSKTNKSVMAKGFYEKYLNDLRNVCVAKGVSLVDFNKTPWDDDKNYIDTVHLTVPKSAEFVRELMNTVASSQNAAVALCGDNGGDSKQLSNKRTLPSY